MAAKEEAITISVAQWQQHQGQLIQLKTDKYNLEEEKVRKQKEFMNIRDRLVKREEELQLLKEMVASSSGQQDKLISLQKENQSLLRSLQQVNEEHQTQHEALRENLIMLTKENEDLKISEQKGRIEAKRAMKDLQTQLETTKDQFQKQQIKMLELSRTANKFDEVQLKAQATEEQLKLVLENELKLQNKLKLEEKEKKILKKNLETISAEKTLILAQLEDIKKEVAEFRAKNGKMDGNSDFTENSQEQKNNEISENPNLSGKLQSENSENPENSENSENSKIPENSNPPAILDSKYVSELSRQNHNFTKTIELLSSQKSQLKVDLEAANAKLRDLLPKLDSSKKEVEDLKAKEKNARELLKKAQSDVRLREEKIQKLETDLQQQEEEGDKIIGKLSDIMLSNDKAKDEIKSLESKLAESEDRSRRQQENFGMLLQQRQKRFTEESEKQSEKIETLESKTKLLEKEVTTLREVVSTLTYDKTAKEEINQMQLTQIDSLKSSISKLSTELSQHTGTHTELARKHTTLLRTLTEKEKLLDSLQNESNNLKATQSDLEILRAQHALLVEKYVRTSEKLEDLQGLLAEEQRKRTGVEEECYLLKEEVLKMKKNIENLTTKGEDLTTQLEQRTQELKAMNDDNNQMRVHVIQLDELRIQLTETEKKYLLEKEAHILAKKTLEEQDMAQKISQRQNVNLIKQLQNQVKLLQGYGLEEGGGMSSTSGTSTPIMAPRSGKSFRGAPGNTVRNQNRPSPSPVRDAGKTAGVAGAAEVGGTDTKKEAVILENDVLVMGLKLGMLQQENFDLEQMNQVLRVEVKKLYEESAKKSQIINRQFRGVKNSITDKKKESQTPAAALSFVGSLFTDNTLQEEKHSKMGTVLEEALMQNIQLQDDIKNIGTEVEKLLKENTDLKLSLQEQQSKKK